MINLRWRVKPVVRLYLAALLFAGCAETTVTPTFRATRGLSRPDRVLVFDFAVTPEEAGAERQSGVAPQTAEDVRVGRSLARALSANLVAELRSRGIEAERAADAAAPGDTTASVRGRFLRSGGSDSSVTTVGFVLRGGQVRTRVQLFQGTGLKMQLVGEGETTTPSGLKPGATAEATIDADARRTAQALAERIAGYYRQEGWIK
ncbi:MAG: DUF4410 domain-containing protein [Alphaproteobacteria bacterium]